MEERFDALAQQFTALEQTVLGGFAETLTGFADLRDAVEHGFARLAGGQSETNARLDRLERKFDRIEARVDHLETKERKKR